MKLICFKTALVFLLPAVIISMAGARSEAVAQLSGTIVSDQKKPVAYSSVSLMSAKDSTLVKGSFSDETGAYVFVRIKPGKYFIVCSATGYQNVKSNVFLLADTTQGITLPVLTMQAVTGSLSAVTVTARKPLIEQLPDRMVVNVENSILSAGNSAMDILERLPGVSVDKDGNITLNGKSGVSVMINDKLTYLTAAQLASLLNSTDGGNIKTIEIITNPSAKFDAAGNGGILNIKMKKNKQDGTNGTLTMGAGYGIYPKDNLGLSFNHKKGKLNIFGNVNRSDVRQRGMLDIFRIVTDEAGVSTYIDQYARTTQTFHNNSYRIGADLDNTSKNALGILAEGYYNTELDGNSITTYINTKPAHDGTRLVTASPNSQVYKDFSVNLNDRYLLDTAGQKLSVDIDYSRINNNSNGQYDTYFFAADGSTQAPALNLRNQTFSSIDIRTAKGDYTYPINKNLLLETGIKLSDVKTDNALDAQLLSGGKYINDTTRTNHFIYDEKISAAYVNLTRNIGHTTVQPGLRAEYTTSRGDLVGKNAPVTQHYFDLFPNIFVHHVINEKNEFGLSFGRRIDRPAYDLLNPFVYYLDQYAFQKGNPFLTPQYTGNFEVNYLLNKSISFGLSYSYTKNSITSLVLTDFVSKASFLTTLNLQSKSAYEVSFFSPYTFAKWWSGNINVVGNYTAFRSDSLLGADLKAGKPGYQFKTTQTFTPVAKLKMELMAVYMSPVLNSVFIIAPRFWMDAGASYSFAAKKANIKLSVSDIFNTRRNNANSNYQTSYRYTIKRETRVARLTFTYNLGHAKIKTPQHQTGADDEKGRVKVNN